MLVIGSSALQVIETSLVNPPKDIDFICTQDEALILSEVSDLSFSVFNKTKAVAKSKNKTIYEFYFYDPEDVVTDTSLVTNPWHLLYLSAQKHICFSKVMKINNSLSDGTITFQYPSIQWLLAQKYTHRFKDSVHFDKTRDLILKLENLGYEKVQHCYFSRIQELFLTKHPKLNVSADEFFKESDGFYKLNHDCIHDSIVHPESPAYKMIITGEVKCNMRLFKQLSFKDQIRCAVEEVAVLAIERMIVPKYGTNVELYPNNAHLTEAYAKAYNIALHKVCTRITSGIFREFCWVHFDEILLEFDMKYLYNFMEAMKTGRVKKFKE